MKIPSSTISKGINTQLIHGISNIKKISLFITHQSNEDATKIKNTMLLTIYAGIVGVIAGLGAVLFRYMIAFFHNIFFLGKLSFNYDVLSPINTTFAWGIIFIPVIGLLIVNFLTEKFAPEAKGHGVPEVMYAVLEKGGKIRSVVAIVKSIASAICIGAGGSVGREGPIVQIGASFGSTLGQLLKLKPQMIITLVSTGVAGGIAATFNAPIGGIAFAIELILPEFSISRLIPLITGATVATYVSSIFLGTEPAFILPVYTLVSPYEFIFYILLGVIAGFVSIAYIRTLYGMESFFNKLKINTYLKAIIGGLLLGGTAYILSRTVNDYYILGVGYSFINNMLNGGHETFLVILLLLVLKILANSITLAAGGSGGVFAPSLFMGIATGTLVGTIAHTLFPGITAPVSAYALVGMAAVVAGTTGAVLTSIIMTFEMTRNYEIMLPLMLTIVISSFVARFFYKDTIYTKKLRNHGVPIELDKLINIFKLTSIREITNPHIISVRPSMKIEDALSFMVFHDLTFIPVIENNKCLGIIAFREIYSLDSNTIIKDVMRSINIQIDINNNAVTALQKMENNQIGLLIVIDADKPVGIITRKYIIKKYFEKRKLLLE